MFKNAEQAIIFAVTTLNSSILKTTTFGEAIPVTGEKMTQQDLHAQAVFIMNAITKQMKESELCYVNARYAATDVEGRVYSRALAYLYVGASVGLSPALAMDLTDRHFSKARRNNESVRQVAYNHGMSYITMRRREEAVTKYLNELWTSVENTVESSLAETGLITTV